MRTEREQGREISEMKLPRKVLNFQFPLVRFDFVSAFRWIRETCFVL